MIGFRGKDSILFLEDGCTYGIVVVPEDVRRRLRAVPDHAGKVDGAASINEQLRTAHDLRVWFWKQHNAVPAH